jgi:hypothetical protein
MQLHDRLQEFDAIQHLPNASQQPKAPWFLRGLAFGAPWHGWYCSCVASGKNEAKSAYDNDSHRRWHDLHALISSSRAPEWFDAAPGHWHPGAAFALQ